MEKEIVNIALNNLKNQIPIELQWDFVDQEIKQNKVRNDITPDGKIILRINGKTFNYWFECKKYLRTIHLHWIFELKRNFKDLLLVADIIYPEIREKLKNQGVNYIDLAGNIFLAAGNNMIFIEGKKNNVIEKHNVTDRAFNRTGLILIFHFLNNEDFINLPYREIAATYQIAIGNVTYIIKNLEELGYVRKIENRNFKLLNKEDLLQKWIQYYPLKVKPNQYIGDFQFFNNNYNDWKSLDLYQGEILWGAEPAANLLTKYLVPAEWTIYTTKPRAELIKKAKLVPEVKGYLKAYKKFWKFNDDDRKTVPPILIYADLMNTGDPRNIETAQKIYEQYIKEQL